MPTTDLKVRNLSASITLLSLFPLLAWLLFSGFFFVSCRFSTTAARVPSCFGRRPTGIDEWE